MCASVCVSFLVCKCRGTLPSYPIPPFLVWNPKAPAASDRFFESQVTYMRCKWRGVASDKSSGSQVTASPSSKISPWNLNSSAGGQRVAETHWAGPAQHVCRGGRVPPWGHPAWMFQGATCELCANSYVHPFFCAIWLFSSTIVLPFIVRLVGGDGGNW